jgi:[histone H3]-lysine4 N-trimethyltransferase SETD1
MFSRANLHFDEVTIFYHPETNKHLGIARIILRASKYMKICVEKFNKKSVMGKVIEVFHDPYGEECKKAYEDLTTEKKSEPPPLPTSSLLPALAANLPELPTLPPIDFNQLEFPIKTNEPPTDDPYYSTSSKYRDKEYEWDYNSGRKYDDDYRSSKYYDKYESRKERDRDRDRGRDKYYHHSSSREDYDRSDRHKRDREKDRRRDYKDSYRDRERSSRKDRDRDYYEYKEKDRYSSYSSTSTSKYGKDYEYYNSSYHQSTFSSSSNSWQPPPPKVAPEESPPRPPPEPPIDEDNDEKLNLKSDDAETSVDLDTRIAMLFNSKPFDAEIPYEIGGGDKKDVIIDGEVSQSNEFDLRKLKLEDEDVIEEGEIKKSLSISDISTIGSVPSPFESCETYKSYLKVQKSRKRRRQARGKHKVESASDISSSEDELLAKGSYSPPLPSIKKEEDQMSLSSLSSTEPVKDEFDIKTFGSYMYPVGFSAYQSAYYNNFHEFQQPTKKKETNDPHEVAVKKVIEKLTYELKQILKKDFNKRMIENTAFKKYEAWWDDQERNKNTRIHTTSESSILTSPTKPIIESKVQTPTVDVANFDYQPQGGTLGILRNLRFQRIKREPVKISIDDGRKSDDEDVVHGSDDEKEDIRLSSKTSYIKRTVAASISSESSESSDESSDDEEDEDEDRDEHAYSSDTASLISDEELAKKIPSKKEKENNRIYSDSESEIEDKPEISKVKTTVSKIYSDSEDDDEGEPAPPGVDPEELEEEIKIEPKKIVEPIKMETSQPATESESDFNEDIPPRTPGRTSSDDKEVIKKTTIVDEDRTFSDSEEERDYQERIRRNTEWMEQIEREAKEKEAEKLKQVKEQPIKEKPKELSPMKDLVKSIIDTKLSKIASIDEPSTPTTSLPPPTPGANMDKNVDPLSNLDKDTSKKKRGRPKGSIGKPKEPKESKKVKNGAFAQPVQQQQNIPLQKYSLKLSPYSSDGGSSHASLVAQEHCYSLPPSESPSLSSSPHDIHLDHDYCGSTKNESHPLQSIQPAQLDEHHKKEGTRPVGRPRKDPNAPKAQYNKKDKQGNVINPQPTPVKSPQKEKYKKVELKQHQKMVENFVPVQRFEKRSPNEEFEVICRFFIEGVDQEDIDYMKSAYTYLIQSDSPGTEKLHEVHWVDHCSTDRSFEPPQAKKRRKDDLPDMREHKTGCARTEGYYKIDSRDKARYKYHHARSGNNDHAANLAVAKMQSASREARSNQRRLLTAFGATESDLLKFNQLKFRKKHLKFAKSAIHDWGLFAMEPIAADEMVIEYVGQMVSVI